MASNIWKYLVSAFSLLLAVIFFQRSKISSILSELSIAGTKEKDATFKEQDRQNSIKIEEEAVHRDTLKKNLEDANKEVKTPEEMEEFFKKKGF